MVHFDPLDFEEYFIFFSYILSPHLLKEQTLLFTHIFDNSA